MQKIHQGVKLALLTALISGIAIFVNKYAVGAITPALVFTATKNSLVGIVIISLLLATKKTHLIKNLNRTQILQLLSISVIGGAIPFYLFFTGLSQTSAINSALIHKSLILWVALLAIPLLKEKLSLWQVGAVGLLFSSNLVVGGFVGFEFTTGELMILSATMLWAVENVIAKKALATTDPDIVTGARMGLGSLWLLIAAQIKHPGALLQITSLSPLQWLWMAITVATLLGYTMSWYRALKVAPATLVTSILVLSTLVTNALSAIFVTHTWSQDMLLQATMIIIGVGLVLYNNQNFKGGALNQTQTNTSNAQRSTQISFRKTTPRCFF